MKLYYMPGACSLASHISLIWAGAIYDLGRLDHATVHAAPFRAINPKGAVPALVLDDGTIITESFAILQYIVDCYPQAGLGGPTGDTLARAQLNERLVELVSEVHKAWAPIFVPERFVTKKINEEDARQAAFGQLDLRYSRLESLMQSKDWLLFGHRTVADAYLYVMCSWKDQTPTPLATYPALTKFKAHLDRDAGVQQALREELPAAA